MSTPTKLENQEFIFLNVDHLYRLMEQWEEASDRDSTPLFDLHEQVSELFIGFAGLDPYEDRQSVVTRYDRRWNRIVGIVDNLQS